MIRGDEKGRDLAPEDHSSAFEARNAHTRHTTPSVPIPRSPPPSSIHLPILPTSPSHSRKDTPHVTLVHIPVKQPLGLGNDGISGSHEGRFLLGFGGGCERSGYGGGQCAEA